MKIKIKQRADYIEAESDVINLVALAEQFNAMGLKIEAIEIKLSNPETEEEIPFI